MRSLEQTVVQAFIRDVAFTYERVHVLTSLFASRAWTTVEELSVRSNTPALLVQETLQELLHAGLVEQDENDAQRFVYAEGDAERDALLVALQQLSEDDPVELARLLNAVALERARDALYARLDIRRS